jgi:hypothetical protein
VRSEAQPDGDPGAGPLGARFASPSGVAMGREELERMSAAFEELDPDHKEVILLSRVVGLSRAEVAAEMDRTEASVRNLLHRALTPRRSARDDSTAISMGHSSGQAAPMPGGAGVPAARRAARPANSRVPMTRRVGGGDAGAPAFRPSL